MLPVQFKTSTRRSIPILDGYYASHEIKMEVFPWDRLLNVNGAEGHIGRLFKAVCRMVSATIQTVTAPISISASEGGRYLDEHPSVMLFG